MNNDFQENIEFKFDLEKINLHNVKDEKNNKNINNEKKVVF